MNIKSEWSMVKRGIIILLDVIVFILSIYISFLVKFKGDVPLRNYLTFEQSAVYFLIIFVSINILLGVYIFYNKVIGDIIFVTVIGQVLITLGMIIINFMGRWFAFPRSVLMLSLIISVVLLSLYRILVYKMYLSITGMKKVAIIGNEEKVRSAVQNFSSKKNNRHQVTYAIINNYYNNVKEIIDKIDIVYLASGIDESERLNIYELVTYKEKKLFLNTSFQNLIMLKPNMMNFEDESIIEASGFRIASEQEFFKRLFDIIVSAILLVITSPIMLITAVVIKLTSPGPVIYKQTRITLNQKEFDILKFRSMSATAEAKTGPVLAASNDARVTPVGKFIRAVRIDELPQLINVLRGDMSIVGPRPERPFFVVQFKKENPYYYLRHNVRAGITGYAQVYGKYASNFNSKLNFDLLYIKNYSLLMDIKILLQTIKILFDKVSSKGLDEEENAIVAKLDPKKIVIMR